MVLASLFQVTDNPNQVVILLTNNKSAEKNIFFIILIQSADQRNGYAHFKQFTKFNSVYIVQVRHDKKQLFLLLKFTISWHEQMDVSRIRAALWNQCKFVSDYPFTDHVSPYIGNSSYKIKFIRGVESWNLFVNETRSLSGKAKKRKNYTVSQVENCF